MNTSVQGEFDFGHDEAARPKKPERLFFAVLPDPGTAMRIAQLADRFVAGNGLKGRRAKTDHLHVSLHHIGDFKRVRSSTLLASTQAGEAVSLAPFEVILHSIGSFGVAKPDGWTLALIGGSDGLTALHDALAVTLKTNGLAAKVQFAPHLTLLYGAVPVAIQAIDPVRFKVIEFVLIHSARGLSKHTALQRWLLRA